MTKRRSEASEAARQLIDAAADPSPERRTEDAEPSPRRRDAGTMPPTVKASAKGTTPGGLIRRTCYFMPEEWAAVLAAAERTDRSAAAFVRHAVRRELERGA